jgi:hypothetical protein
MVQVRVLPVKDSEGVFKVTHITPVEVVERERRELMETTNPMVVRVNLQEF